MKLRHHQLCLYKREVAKKSVIILLFYNGFFLLIYMIITKKYNKQIMHIFAYIFCHLLIVNFVKKKYVLDGMDLAFTRKK